MDEKGVNIYAQDELTNLEKMKENLDKKIAECEASNDLASSTKENYAGALKELEDCKAIVNKGPSEAKKIQANLHKIYEFRTYWSQYPTSHVNTIAVYTKPVLTKEEIAVFVNAEISKKGDHLSLGARSLIETEDRINTEEMNTAILRSFKEWDSATDKVESKKRVENFLSDMTYFHENVFPYNDKITEWIGLANEQLKKL